MEKLKINHADCERLVASVFFELSSVWLNRRPVKPCIEIAILNESDEYDFSDPDEDLSDVQDWIKDMYEQEWSARDTLASWTHSVELEKAPGWQGIVWMEDFVENVIAPKDARGAIKMARAIGGKGTFYRFKVTAAECGHLQEWYNYLNARQYDYVEKQLRDAGVEVVESGGMPIIDYPTGSLM